MISDIKDKVLSELMDEMGKRRIKKYATNSTMKDCDAIEDNSKEIVGNDEMVEDSKETALEKRLEKLLKVKKV